MESLQKLAQKLYQRVRLSNTQQAMAIYCYCQLVHISLWVLIAVSMIVTQASLTFGTSTLQIPHCLLIIVFLNLSLATKVLLAVSVFIPRQSFRVLSFTLATLCDTTIPLLDAVAASQVIRCTTTFPQLATVGSSCFVNFVLGVVIRLLN